jgi:hypothetical protein
VLAAGRGATAGRALSDEILQRVWRAAGIRLAGDGVPEGAQDAGGREQDHGAALLYGDAAGNEPLGLVWCKGVGEELTPAERLERMLQDETS